MLAGVFNTFAARLAFGVLGFAAMIPERETGKGFPRLIAILSLSFLTIASVWHPPGGGLGFGNTAAIALGTGLGLVLLLNLLLPILPTGLSRWILAMASLAGIIYFVAIGREERRGIAAIPDGLTSASLLGSTIVAMILGHWYLVSKGLKLRHLVVLTGALVASVLLRAAYLLFFALPARGGDWSAVAFVSGDALFFVLWIFLGLLGPLLVGLLALRTAKMGSTQSATGLLYVATILVLMGELIASYLSFAPSS